MYVTLSCSHACDAVSMFMHAFMYVCIYCPLHCNTHKLILGTLQCYELQYHTILLYVYVHTYVYVCLYMYIYMYIKTYMHTYMHTYKHITVQNKYKDIHTCAYICTCMSLAVMFALRGIVTKRLKAAHTVDNFNLFFQICVIGALMQVCAYMHIIQTIACV
jgi:hypothetical protein